MKLSVHDILRRVAPYFAERASQFALKPAHPHRLILDRPEPIAHCHARLLAIYKGSIFSNIDAIAEFTSDIIVAAAGNLPKKPSTAIVKAMVAWVHSLLIDNDLWFTFPTFDEALSRDQNYVMPLRRKLQEIEPILVHQAQIVETFVRIATDTLAAIADNYLPDAAFSEETGPATFTVPLLTL